jgi:glycosyltransferase involved in cell wall biosynthesis
MPVYNGLPYLPAAVDSILSQTYTRFKLLIINDGSTDDSASYLDNLNDPRINVVHQPKVGLGSTLNAGLALCHTELVARMDADDISLPGRLMAQFRFLRANPEVGLVGTQISYFTVAKKGFSPPLPIEHSEIYRDLLQSKHALCHPTIMARTDLLKEVGYRTKGIGEDWDMFLRMGEITKLANLDEKLYWYRLHFGSINATRLLEVRRQYAYAAYCAIQRSHSACEPSFAEFLKKQGSRRLITRYAEQLSIYALLRYRLALVEILNGHLIKGYVQLIYAAVCSPAWTWQRIARVVRRFWLG